MFRRSKIFTLFLTLFFVCSTHFLFAETNVIKEKQDAIKAGNNMEHWFDEGLTSNLVSVSKQLIGPIPDNVLDGTVTSFLPGGALGTTTGFIASLFSPPASGIQYLAQVKDNFLGKSAYAQGAGFIGLQPILPLWRTFRNFTYVLSSVLFVAIGLMIILRVKISPQAVITVQNAIPQAITTLVLITFSYAIAGLLIDLSNLIQGIAISGLFLSTGKSFASNLFSSFYIPQGLVSWIQSTFNISTPWDYSLSGLLSNNGFFQTLTLVVEIIPILAFVIPGAIIGALFGVIASGTPIGSLIGAGGGVAIVIVILEIIVLLSLINFLIGLIKVYINVLLKIILGPIQIAMGVFPGAKGGFSTWLWELIANLAVFPGCFIFLVIINLLVEMTKLGVLWVPSIIGVGSPSLATGAAASYLASTILPGLIGLGGFLLLSKLPDLIPVLVFSVKPSEWGKSIQASISPLSPMALVGSVAEKIKTYDTLTGRKATEDITSVSSGLKSLWKKKQTNSANGTPPSANKYGSGLKSSGFDPKNPRGNI